MGQKDKGLERYQEIVDEQVDESKLAYAAICAVRGRTEEARKLVEDALAKQKVKSPNLLQFRALLATIDNDLPKAFDLLAESIEIGADQENNNFMGGGGASADMLAGFAKRTGMLDQFVQF